MQLLVLRLDYKSSAVIERLQELAALTAQTDQQHVPPHLSLQTYTQTDPITLKAAVENSISQWKEIPLTFSSIGFFKQTGTIFAAPGIPKALIDLHLAVHSGTRDISGQNSLYKPDNWVPHATLSNNVALPIWGPLFARLAMEFEPFDANVVAIECWSISGGRTVTDWSFFSN